MDKKAKQILLKTFWSSQGWKDRPYVYEGEDFVYAKSKGMMFDPLTIHHDEAVRQIVGLHEQVTKEKVAKAFLHSLSTRKIHLRSALASWVLTRQFVQHSFESNAGRYTAPANGVAYAMYGDCYVCDSYHIAGLESYTDEDMNVLNFERHKWGGVRLNYLPYVLQDLQLMSKEPELELEVTVADVAIWRQVLAAIESCEPTDAARQLEKRLAGLFPSSKNERDAFMEILASAGILATTKDRPGRGGKNDFFAVVNWRGEDGYSRQAVQDLFGTWM
ncbi:hypothetical protein [Brevibacillus sp. HD1.4A]|uniref:hypothetical protein n=1 Tax=Brevibacillus sp. HD1.4A TaxID=2738978 RepID=UPI00156B9EA2|nr:hypothetical protein [Brevibacillus sp. HD1.4A]NRQ54992.1 hypothetical protein [Brevibacillus sp. HD1.4A]